MHTIRKIFKFEMAHQLYKAYSKDCKEQIHGHSYVLELFFKSDFLDDTGMVIDFGHVKDKIKSYIDTWDHCLVMPNYFPDSYLKVLKTFNKKMKIVSYNPTAEQMACEMYFYIQKYIPLLSKVRLHETTTGYAEYERN